MKPPDVAQSGIDILVSRRVSLEELVEAIADIAGIHRGAIKLPDDPESKVFEMLDSTYWAIIHAYPRGDFAFKADLDGRTPRDYISIAMALAKSLGVAVAWPDERTLAVTAAILCQSDGSTSSIAINDVMFETSELEGLEIQISAPNEAGR